ncbi:MAG TPA: hypothetical protein VMF32_23095 [Xanthobacteraceae bacterium]|nr:hypothetical protein [Xanthobacteraceae bacterium]
MVSDAGRAAGCITDDPPDAATYTAHVLLGDAIGRVGRVVRMNPMVQPVPQAGGRGFPEGIPQPVFAALVLLGMDAIESADVELIKQLGTAWIHQRAPNQPIRMRDDLQCAVGDATYEAAKQRWRALAGPPPAPR